jgi:ribosomal protein L40E
VIDLFKYCPKCGAKNEKDSKFCGKCGNQLEMIQKETINNTVDNDKNLKIIYIIALIGGIIAIVGSFTILVFFYEFGYLDMHFPKTIIAIVFSFAGFFSVLYTRKDYLIGYILSLIFGVIWLLFVSQNLAFIGEDFYDLEYIGGILLIMASILGIFLRKKLK